MKLDMRNVYGDMGITGKTYDSNLSESAEVEFYVNLYWRAHYQAKDYDDSPDINYECIICNDFGKFDADFGATSVYCICPKGMERRKEKN